MTANIFKSASLKLTAVYLYIIIFISLLFSFGIYDVSSDELKTTIYRPLTEQQKIRIGIEDDNQLNELRKQEFHKATRNLRNKLILTNIAIITGGGVISYYLARKTLKPIEEAHEAQSRFTADAAHELRTPITAMRTETEVALMDESLTVKEARAQLESNIEELIKLSELTEGLLTLTRLTANNLEKEKVAIKLIVEEAASRVTLLTNNKKQSINITGDINKEIGVNQPLITEALVTLLDNASKHAPEDSNISLHAKTSSKTATFTVTDLGPGISSKDLPHIFERFYRADTSRTKSQENGYGIGLSIAKSIAEVHGGSISATSSPKKGTTFTFTIPC